MVLPLNLQPRLDDWEIWLIKTRLYFPFRIRFIIWESFWIQHWYWSVIVNWCQQETFISFSDIFGAPIPRVQRCSKCTDHTRWFGNCNWSRMQLCGQVILLPQVQTAVSYCLRYPQWSMKCFIVIVFNCYSIFNFKLNFRFCKLSRARIM